MRTRRNKSKAHFWLSLIFFDKLSLYFILVYEQHLYWLFIKWTASIFLFINAKFYEQNFYGKLTCVNRIPTLIFSFHSLATIIYPFVDNEQEEFLYLRVWFLWTNLSTEIVQPRTLFTKFSFEIFYSQWILNLTSLSTEEINWSWLSLSGNRTVPFMIQFDPDLYTWKMKSTQPFYPGSQTIYLFLSQVSFNLSFSIPSSSFSIKENTKSIIFYKGIQVFYLEKDSNHSRKLL